MAPHRPSCPQDGRGVAGRRCRRHHRPRGGIDRGGTGEQIGHDLLREAGDEPGQQYQQPVGTCAEEGVACRDVPVADREAERAGTDQCIEQRTRQGTDQNAQRRVDEDVHRGMDRVDRAAANGDRNREQRPDHAHPGREAQTLLRFRAGREKRTDQCGREQYRDAARRGPAQIADAGARCAVVHQQRPDRRQLLRSLVRTAGERDHERIGQPPLRPAAEVVRGPVAIRAFAQFGKQRIDLTTHHEKVGHAFALVRAKLRIGGVAVRELDHDAIFRAVHRIGAQHAVEDFGNRVADIVGLADAQICDAKLAHAPLVPPNWTPCRKRAWLSPNPNADVYSISKDQERKMRAECFRRLRWLQE